MFEDMTFSQQGIAVYHGIEVSWCLAAAASLDEKLLLILPENMTSFHLEKSENIRAVWQGHPQMGKDFQVEVIWKKDDDTQLYSGKLSWRNNSSNLAVEEIRFPDIKTPIDEDSRFLKPDNLGELVTMRYAKIKAKRSFYASMQWTAIFPAGKNYGFYLDCRDSQHFIKQYDYQYSDGIFTHSPVFYVPLLTENTSEFTLPYCCTFGRFEGFWYEAAQIYRSWALKQDWYINCLPVKKQLYDTAMWVWNRGTPEEVIPPAERLRKDAGVPVALDWYWWHSNPYDTDYPDFWPPRNGEETFKENIRYLNEQNIFVQVYTNGMTWDTDTASFERDNGRDCLQINRDNSPTAMMFNPYTRHRLAIMCGEAPEYHKKMQFLADKLAGSGLPALYLDMIGSYAFSPCRNKAHRHAPGGGTYQKEGYYAYVQEIRRRHPDLILSTEYASEMIDLFESFIMLDSSLERCYGSEEMEAVPAFQAVYHESGTTIFGSYAIPDGIPPWDPRWPDKDRWQFEEDWHRQFEHQFFIELARCIIWGIQPCVCNLKLAHAEDPEFADEYSFILKTAQFYHANREILAGARLLSPEGFECEYIPVKFMKRGIFTLREDMNIITRKQPAVLHSFWQDADGKKILIAANYTRQERVFKYRTSNGAYRNGHIPPLSFARISLDKEC